MTTTALPLTEVQGLILRGYGMDALRVFVLSVQDAAAARAMLGKIPVTTSEPWSEKPAAAVNIALTYEGLVALGLSAESLASFPAEFQQGAAARAAVVGDSGASDPSTWVGGLGGAGVHILVLVYAQTAAFLETQSAALQGLWSAAVRELSVHDAAMLPGNVAHFGYRDGFSQPTITGGLANPVPEATAPAPAGEFVLGYPSQFSEFSYPIPQPAELGNQGSFVAFRILAQDCAGFEQLLDTAPSRYGISRELLAAKLVGRWRNGTPLVLSPTTDTPTPPIADTQMNTYDYLDDPKGTRCPIGAHMRRANPRSSMIAGGGGTNHRIVRRGLPYGPPYDPAHPDDGIERGLLGIFICVSLKDQFEFLMQQWMNGDTFAPGIAGSKDPMLGNIPPNSGKFTIPVEGAAPIVVTGFSSLVRTRGGAYGFMPSISALRYIAALYV